MTVFEFEKELRAACEAFKGCNTMNARAFVAKLVLDKCTNSFEEQCVVERLKELRP